MTEKQVRTFAMRLTDDEMAVIDGKAKKLGLSRAGLLRRLFERAGLLAEPDRNTGEKKGKR